MFICKLLKSSLCLFEADLKLMFKTLTLGPRSNFFSRFLKILMVAFPLSSLKIRSRPLPRRFIPRLLSADPLNAPAVKRIALESRVQNSLPL